MTHSPAQPKALDFAAIKARVSIVSVLASYGIELRGRGTERMARCPFHEDRSPSLQVSIEKNLFTCFACGACGSVIDFVAKKEGCLYQPEWPAPQWLPSRSASEPRLDSALVEEQGPVVDWP